MENQQLPSSPSIPTRRHTMPHVDFVLPSYSRDRRLSSINSVRLPETILEHVATDASFSTAQQDVSSGVTDDRYSLEQMVSYRHGRHVEDKALSRQVR